MQRIYPRRYARFKGTLDYPTPVKIQNENGVAHEKVSNIVNNHLYPLAAEVWAQFDPGKIK